MGKKPYEIHKDTPAGGAVTWHSHCKVCERRKEGLAKKRDARAEVKEHLETEHGVRFLPAGAPRAHVYGEGGALVTRTHDLELARTTLEAELRQQGIDDETYPPEWEPDLVYGRVVPIAPNMDSDYTWTFHELTEAEAGQRGVTKAVIWRA